MREPDFVGGSSAVNRLNKRVIYRDSHIEICCVAVRAYVDTGKLQIDMSSKNEKGWVKLLECPYNEPFLTMPLLSNRPAIVSDRSKVSLCH